MWPSLVGELTVVPSFASIQAGAAEHHRARVVAGVNVLNAAFMTAATVLVAVLQKFGVGVPKLFVLIGATTLMVAILIRRTMPKPD